MPRRGVGASSDASRFTCYGNAVRRPWGGSPVACLAMISFGRSRFMPAAKKYADPNALSCPIRANGVSAQSNWMSHAIPRRGGALCQYVTCWPRYLPVYVARANAMAACRWAVGGTLREYLASKRVDLPTC